MAVTGSFGLTGTGGSKTVTALESTFGSMNWALSGVGPGGATLAETVLFTDDTVAGVATIKNTLNGDTVLHHQHHVLNLLWPSHTWGGLAITNGTGSDINSITDTDFTGSVAINNGKGDNTQNQFGGSETIFADNNNVNLLAIHGSLSISTGHRPIGHRGPSTTTSTALVTLGAAAGIAGQKQPELHRPGKDNQTVATLGHPGPRRSGQPSPARPSRASRRPPPSISEPMAWATASCSSSSPAWPSPRPP